MRKIFPDVQKTLESQGPATNRRVATLLPLTGLALCFDLRFPEGVMRISYPSRERVTMRDHRATEILNFVI